MVEVFAIERTAENATSGVMSPVMSGARTDSPGADSSSATSKDKQQQQQQRERRRARRIKVGMSDLHSSIKEGCLM